MAVILSVHIEQLFYFHQALHLILVVTDRCLWSYIWGVLPRNMISGKRRTIHLKSRNSGTRGQCSQDPIPTTITLFSTYLRARGKSLRLTLLSFQFRLNLQGTSEGETIIGQGPTNENDLHQPGGYSSAAADGRTFRRKRGWARTQVRQWVGRITILFCGGW